jgi:hypothetical protein
MATTSNGLYPPANDMNVLTRLVNTGNVPIQVAISGAIATQMLLGVFTCTQDLASYSSDIRNEAMNALNGLGYQVSYSGHTLTLKW